MATTQVPLDEAPDPTEDTPDAQSEDTAADDADAGPVDWERRYKEAQQVISRQGAELSLYRKGTSDSDPDEGEDEEDDADDGDADAGRDPALGRLEEQSWELARKTYGEQAVVAYEAWYRGYQRAETPMDAMAALEAYYEARTGTPQVPKAKGQASPPAGGRVDTNRSDPSPDPDELITEARKSGDLSAFTSAAAARLGFGPKRR